MLLLGFEPQDVLRVVVGIALGLLTVYRRELSCNRDYHPDEYDGTLGSSEHGPSLRDMGGDTANSSPLLDDHDTPSIVRVISRRKSSSSLLTASHHDEDRRVMDVISNKNKEDPTEELLESAGFFLSGGPFLHMAITVFHHLVVTSFIGTQSSVSSMLRGFSATTIDRFFPGTPCQENSIRQTPEPSHAENQTTQQNHQHLYSVAWNAGTEYFTSISAKLDRSHRRNSYLQRSGDSISRKKHSRFKSTGNLQQYLSDEHSRMIFREMVAMKKLDVTLLPSDAQIAIFSYLPPADVLAFMCTNKAGRNLLDDGDSTVAEGDDSGGVHVKNGDTALLIWKSLFHRDYSWVLSDWDIGIEAFQRSMANYHCRHQRQQPCPKAGKVFRHLLSTIVDSELPFGTSIGASSSIQPTTSMKDFYFIFSETWLNYTIAGCNSPEKCFIGLHGHVFDISNFVEVHPGSTETLLLQAGRDATVFFESMGHSLGARKLALGMCAVVNGQCTRHIYTGGEEMCGSFQLAAGASRPPFSTCGLIKSKCRSLDVRRNVPGFLIPRKRSMPRIQGGLHHIRERLRREEELELVNAARWGNESLGPNGLFGGVHVYYDPFRGWQWWYTDRDFNVVYTARPQ